MAQWSRRRFLSTGAAAAAGVSLANARLLDALAATGSGRPWSMAMHIHSSFSEGVGSMEAQLDEASRNAVDVVWWTDHDWRMAAYSYRRLVHFNSLTDEPEDGHPLSWQRSTTGGPASSTAEIVRNPVSPKDPDPGGALRLAATAAGAGPAEVRVTAVVERDRLKRSLAGQRLELEVFPQTGGDGYLELRLDGSYRPPRGSRPAGRMVLSYRFGGTGARPERRAAGLTGVITLPAAAQRWTSFVIDPAADAAALWPDIDSRDSSLVQLSLAAVSSSGTHAGVIDYLRFNRSQGGAEGLAAQREMAVGYRNRFPSVTTHVGSEISYYDPHLNWYGGRVELPDYGRPHGGSGAAFAKAMTAEIHRAGGLAAYNHVFGVAILPLRSAAEQEARRRSVTAMLLKGDALGADLLEVGYRVRGNVTIERHMAAWDACSRNALYLTGTGTSDDHNGQDWATQLNRFLTYAWAPSPSEENLVAALGAGRAFFGELGTFSGALDLLVDGTSRMGSVSTSSAAYRDVRITAAGLPAGSTLQVVTGPVDHAGPGVPEPGTRIVASRAAASISNGVLDYRCATTRPTFLRTQVVDRSGALIAVSNPVWLLRGGAQVPAARR